MDKIAKTSIKNTKRILKKLSEAQNLGLSYDIEDFTYKVRGFMPTPSLQDFVKKFETKELFIEYCSNNFSNPYEAIKFYYKQSKQTLIALRNLINSSKCI